MNRMKYGRNTGYNIVDNKNGVSSILGFILAFAIIIGLFGIMQTVFVPEWTRTEEVSYSKLVLSEFSAIQKVVSLSSSLGDPNTVTIDLGVKHSSYPFLLTPPDMASSLKVRKLNFTITYNETLPNGSVYNKTLTYNTSAIILTPNYLYLDKRDLIYEHGYAFKRFETANITIVEQSSFRSDRITFYLLNATFDSISSVQPVSLVFAPVSYGGNIKVDNATLTFESLNPEYWNETLRDIGQVNVSGNLVELKIENAVISLAVLSSSTEGNYVSIAPQLDLIVPLSSRLDLFVGETEKVEVLARDQFGNPMSGVTVNASVNGTIGHLDRNASTTDLNGVATFYFTALLEGSGTIDFQADSKQASLPVTVVDVSVQERKWDQNTFNTSVVVSPDFVWTDIYNASKIILKNATSITGEPQSKFELRFVVYNDTVFYYFEILGKKKNQRRVVSLYKNLDINFGFKYKRLTSDAWDNIFNSIGADLLNKSNYESPNSVKNALDEVRNFLQNATQDNPVNLAIQSLGHEGEGGWKVEIQII